MKRILAVTVAVLLLVGVQAVEVIEANPVFWPPTPNIEQPMLKIENPTNSSTYERSIILGFKVTRPNSYDEDTQSFAAHPFDGRFPYLDGIESIDVYLDGTLRNSTNLPKSYLSYRFTFELNQLSPGPHTLNVTVLAYTYYNGPQYNESDVAESRKHDNAPIYRHSTTVSDTVNFTITDESPPTQSAPPASVTLATPSNTPPPTPTVTPAITPPKLPTQQSSAEPSVSPSIEPISWIAVELAGVFIAVLVCTGALLYLRGRKG